MANCSFLGRQWSNMSSIPAVLSTEFIPRISPTSSSKSLPSSKVHSITRASRAIFGRRTYPLNFSGAINSPRAIPPWAASIIRSSTVSSPSLILPRGRWRIRIEAFRRHRITRPTYLVGKSKQTKILNHWTIWEVIVLAARCRKRANYSLLTSVWTIPWSASLRSTVMRKKMKPIDF